MISMIYNIYDIYSLFLSRRLLSIYNRHMAIHTYNFGTLVSSTKVSPTIDT